MLSFIKISFCFAALCLPAFVELNLLRYDFQLDNYCFYEYYTLYVICFLLSLIFKNNYIFAAVVIYLLAGLCGLPIFAFGGGWQYIYEPSFGYLLGLIPLSILGFFFRYHLPHYGFHVFGRNLTPVLALWSAHLIGFVFLLCTQRLSMTSFESLGLWQLFYDTILGILICLALG